MHPTTVELDLSAIPPVPSDAAAIKLSVDRNSVRLVLKQARVFTLDPSWTLISARDAARAFTRSTAVLSDLVLVRVGEALLAVYGPTLRHLSVGDVVSGDLTGEVAAVIPGTVAGAWAKVQVHPDLFDEEWQVLRTRPRAQPVIDFAA